jgi:outer membrane protein TolC
MTMQAEVARGRAEVDLLLAENRARVAKLRLVEVLGIQVPADQIELVSEFEIFEPQLDMEAMINDALTRHPTLIAAQADRAAAQSTVKVAKASYFPTLSLRASWSGFTRDDTDTNAAVDRALSNGTADGAANTAVCNDFNTLFTATGEPVPPQWSNCSLFAFTSNDSVQTAQVIEAANSTFPFSFNNEPVSVQAFFSMPLFNGFGRQVQVEQAIARRNDLDYQVRGIELQLRANVTEAVHNLDTAYRTVLLQRENTAQSREGLRLATERYQLGAGTFLELLDSQTLTQQAEVDEIDSVFMFHQSLVALEQAVGRSLDLGGQ